MKSHEMNINQYMNINSRKVRDDVRGILREKFRK